jgi:hypothetical protein
MQMLMSVGLIELKKGYAADLLRQYRRRLCNQKENYET